MKELLALLLLVILLGIGWNQSYKAQFRYVSGLVSATASKKSPNQPAAPPVRNATGAQRF